jgi:hypothetical protein
MTPALIVVFFLLFPPFLLGARRDLSSPCTKCVFDLYDLLFRPHWLMLQCTKYEFNYTQVKRLFADFN